MKPISRRSVLRTSAGLFALPWLESHLGGRLLHASENVPTPPKRFVALFFPNGVYPSAWEARTTADGLQFGGSLAPLQKFATQSIVISGLNNPLGGHLGQTSGFLSGVDFEPDASGAVRGATSLDQMLAQRFALETFLPSLNLAVEPPSQGGFGNRPRSFGNSISWSSPTNKIEPQINPQQAFDQVFFGQTEAGRVVATRRKRIVDQVWNEANALNKYVSAADRNKLNQYLDSIRDLESKLEKTLSPKPRSWTPPQSGKLDRPEESGIPADHQQHLRMMMRILLLSLQTDSTRVATFVMGHSISRIVFDFIDKKLKRNHHDYSHHRNDPEKIAGYNQITSWFAGECAWLLQQMSAIDEGDGTLLDNSVVLFGSGMKDGNTHEPLNVPIALFGSGGGCLRTGHHITAPQDSVLSILHLTLLHAFGIESENFNGVTDKTLDGLLA
jgi:Protein of unknown function (DUF1552)